MKINVRFFAILKDRAGVAAAEVDVPEGSTVSTALEAVLNKFPEIRKDLQRAAFAVNRSYVKPEAVLHDGDELSLIPPVSGG